MENKSVPKKYIGVEMNKIVLTVSGNSPILRDNKELLDNVINKHPGSNDFGYDRDGNLFFTLDDDDEDCWERTLTELLKNGWKTESEKLRKLIPSITNPELKRYLLICIKNIPTEFRTEYEFAIALSVDEKSGITGFVDFAHNENDCNEVYDKDEEKEDFLDTLIYIPFGDVELQSSNFLYLYGKMEHMYFFLKKYIDHNIARNKVLHSATGSFPINDYWSNHKGNPEKRNEICLLYGLTPNQVDMIYEYSDYRWITILDLYLATYKSFSLILSKYYEDVKYLYWDWNTEYSEQLWEQHKKEKYSHYSLGLLNF